MGLLSELFKGKTKKQEQINAILEQDGIIIDVRTPQEFKSGHVTGSRNIPLSDIKNNIEFIKKLNKPVVLCCASGMRSAQATNILKGAGIDAINAGSWRSLVS